jgi:hypothetical protein
MRDKGRPVEAKFTTAADPRNTETSRSSAPCYLNRIARMVQKQQMGIWSFGVESLETTPSQGQDNLFLAKKVKTR